MTTTKPLFRGSVRWENTGDEGPLAVLGRLRRLAARDGWTEQLNAQFNRRAAFLGGEELRVEIARFVEVR